MSTISITSSKLCAFLTILTLSLSFGGTAIAAPPDLWWDHIGPLDITRSECMAKGEQLLSKNNAGRIRASEDSLHASNDTSISVIECLAFGQGMTVMVVVSSNDLAKGDQLFNSLKDGMAK